jgi:hypothetical protein
VSEPGIVQGRRIGLSELEQIRQWMVAHPDWSRHRLSRHVATQWDWRNPAGQLKDMAARTLLLKLERRGWIVLPPRRHVAASRMRQKPMPAVGLPVPESPITQPLTALLPLTLTEVSRPGSSQRGLFEALLHQHHYLSHRSSVGENLQYVVSDRQGRTLACVLFGAAAWQCADRDRYVGWDASTRSQRLHLLTNNTRFLIPAWVQVRHLASHVLSRIAQCLSDHWQAKYGHPLYLLETFVERDRFDGACYRAANWVRVGQTQGRSRQDRPDGSHHQVPIKDVYLRPLHPQFRELLCGTPPTLRP